MRANDAREPGRGNPGRYARMKPHRALMIVDVQRAFAPPPAFIRKLTRYARRFPCRIFTRYVNPSGSAFRRLLKQKCCAPNSEDVELIIPPQRGDLVLDKVARYGLTPAQIKQLKRRRISCVTVCGLDTDACVLAVMFSLFDEGIECHLKEEMCWSSSGLHKPAVAIIREQFPAPR
jgi:nicotinamidase-related amidase